MIRRLAPLTAVLALASAACGRTDFSVTSLEPQEGGFFTQVLDFEGDVGHGLAMAMDAEGNPHLTYLGLPEEEAAPAAGPTPSPDAGVTPQPGPTGTPGATPTPAETVLGVPTLPAVLHAHLVENILTRAKVADALSDLTAEDETAIAVDADGVHHVVWTEGGSSLWYSNTAEGDFGTAVEIPLVGDEVSGVSLAVAEDGTPYAAFTEGTGVEGPGAIVRVAAIEEPAEGQILVETAAEAGAPGPTAIGAGAQGVLVAYGDEGETLVARDEGALWSSEVADEDGGLAVSMALDPDGNPHLAYANAGGLIKHAHSIDGGAWEVSIIGRTGFDPAEHEGLGAGIALDADGVHHVVWTDATSLSYSNNADGPFARSEEIPGTETEPAPETPRIGIGAENTVYIGWFDPGDTEVELTHRADDAPPLALPSPSPTLGGGTTGGGPCEPESTTELQIAAPPGAVTDGFDKDCLAVNASEAFTVAFANEDTSIHNWTLYTDDSAEEHLGGGPPGEPIDPGGSTTYEVDAIDEPGQYFFQCDFHVTTMTGTFVVAETGGGGAGGGGNGGG